MSKRKPITPFEARQQAIRRYAKALLRSQMTADVGNAFLCGWDAAIRWANRYSKTKKKASQR